MIHADLKNLPVGYCDVQNVYLQDLFCGLEFRLENVEKHAIIVGAIHGSASNGAYYWQHDLSAIEEMGFSSCKADPDVWLRLALKSNELEHYQRFLLYTDDILAIV